MGNEAAYFRPNLKHRNKSGREMKVVRELSLHGLSVSFD